MATRAAVAKRNLKRPSSARGAAAAVATPLPANRAAANREIPVARASGTTSVAQVCSVECMKATPAHQHRRDTNPYERVSHGTRGVTEGEHAAPDKDERRRPE